MKISDILPPFRHRLWTIAKQGGATHAVSRLPLGADGKISWEYLDLLHLKESYQNFGLQLEVIEPGLDGQMHDMKLGTDKRDLDIEHCKQLIRNMGTLGIPVFCYNFMAKFNWVRTSTTTPTRGGALVTSYDHSLMEHAPLTDAGIVTADTLWENIKYFLEAVVPVAEEYKVKLALHPDDPPVASIRGISRIVTSAAALQKVLDMVPSPYSGITLCQGTLAAAGEDIPAIIREFGHKKKIFFVHFRDVKGTAERFTETFHDDGQTNMLEAVKAYREVGFDGPVRIDHAPTLEGEDNKDPGYAEMGRLFALGYLRGLMDHAGY
ncbi:mannonate dehydratase [Parapedobacter defluvii]|uniref:mannonate dehydratase n=1 Tax=Parapedobacter defluvii TaxID=2045106 RepID=A0ABQ1L404_9SPHI|nr:mannonate dehydratase [Parapedobacter defluvii]RQP14048.1 MAG: mannonate dehydratase [Parapedobacter sp.]GGC15506.1 mannonate dehydratase [Parapedobacter defluvii]